MAKAWKNWKVDLAKPGELVEGVEFLPGEDIHFQPGAEMLLTKQVAVLGGAVAPSGALSPDQLSIAPFAWYKANALVLNDGDLVASWTDSSGNGRHATQATGAKKPTFKTNIVNGLPVVRTVNSGTSQQLATASFGTQAQPATIFAVVNWPAVVPSSSIGYIFDGIDGTNRQAVLFSILGTNIEMFAGTEVGIPDVAASTWYLFVFSWNGANSFVNRNGVKTTVNPGTKGVAGLTLFGDWSQVVGMLGDIAELGFYVGTLSDADIIGLRTSLSAKYSQVF